jgi:hypothetical protein
MPIAWRHVREDWSSPRNRTNPVSTPPGATVEDAHGLFASPNWPWYALNCCRHAHRHGFRVVLVEYDTNDIVRGSGPLRLHRLHVLAEVPAEDVQAVAQGADHTPVVERILGASQTVS